MIKNMPGSIPSATLGLLIDVMQKIASGGITHSQLGKFAKKQNPFAVDMTPAGQLASWGELLKTLFGLEIDTTTVPIPEPVAGLDRLIVVPKGLTLNQIIEVCCARFENIYLAYNDLDKSVAKNDRINNETYAIWVRDRVEADEELNNLSAEDLAKQKIPSLTLMERLLYGLKYHEEMGNHLDVEGVTLCQGSRYLDGNTPCVYSRHKSHKLCVGSYHPGRQDAGVRGRQVIC